MMQKIRRLIRHWITWDYSNYSWQQVKKHLHHDLTLVEENIFCVTLECLTCSAHIEDWWDSKGIHEAAMEEEEEENV